MYDIYFCAVFLNLVAGIRERPQSPSVARDATDDGPGHSAAPAGQSVGAGTAYMPFPIGNGSSSSPMRRGISAVISTTILLLVTSSQSVRRNVMPLFVFTPWWWWGWWYHLSYVMQQQFRRYLDIFSHLILLPFIDEECRLRKFKWVGINAQVWTQSMHTHQIQTGCFLPSIM